jgi:hypothetical protein
VTSPIKNAPPERGKSSDNGVHPQTFTEGEKFYHKASPAVADGAAFVLPLAARRVSQRDPASAGSTELLQAGGVIRAEGWSGITSSSHSRHRANPKSGHSTPAIPGAGPTYEAFSAPVPWAPIARRASRCNISHPLAPNSPRVEH